MSPRVLLMMVILVGGSLPAFAADSRSVDETDQAAKPVTKWATTIQRRTQSRPEDGRVEPGSAREETDSRVPNNVPIKTLKPKLPDISVMVAPPMYPDKFAFAYVKNEGGGDIQSPFTVAREIESWCEVGKLKSNVAVHKGSNTVVPQLLVGHSKPVLVIPASMIWGANGCYYHVTVRVDTADQILELDEKNNKATTHFCPKGATCY